MAEGLNILQFYSDNGPGEWNVSQWRSLSPANAVNAAHERGETPHTMQLYFLPSALNWKHPEVMRKVGMGDVLIFQRNAIVAEVWEAMDYWRALGKAVVVDIDDHYPMIPPSNPAFDPWIRNRGEMKPDPVSAFEEGLRHANGLMSPSKVILQDWASVVRGYYQPNLCTRAWYADLDQKPLGVPDVELSYQVPEGVSPSEIKKPPLTPKIRRASEGQIILGWGGSISHVDSWLFSGILEALDRLLSDYPQVRLKFCGNEDRLDSVFRRWGDKVIRQNGVAHEDWPIVISSFDIGLAPLDLTPLQPWKAGGPIASYDERRSWLKGAEYLCAGVPWIGSRSLTYNDLARNGTLVENTPEAWYNALKYKIIHLEQEKREAWHRRKWALRALTLEGQITNYLSVYERIFTERQGSRGVTPPGVLYHRREQVAVKG